MEEKKERSVWQHHFGSLKSTKGFLEAKKALEPLKENGLVIFTDCFPKEDYDQREIIQALDDSIVVPHRSVCFQWKSNFHCPDGIGCIQTIDELRKIIDGFDNVMFVAPYTIHHDFLFDVVVRGKQWPGLDKDGAILSDASWALDNLSGGDVVATIINATGYAMPYPDVVGDGSGLLDTAYAVAKGMDYFVPDYFSKERIENSVRLADTVHRTGCYRRGVVNVHSSGFGEFHTGTLIAKIQGKWPETKRVEIVTRNKKGEMQISLASISEKIDIPGELKGHKGIKIMSPQYIHFEKDVWHKFVEIERNKR